MNNSYEDNFIYEVLRPGPASPNLELSFTLQAANYAYCESDIHSESIIVPSEPQLKAAFLANPEIGDKELISHFKAGLQKQLTDFLSSIQFHYVPAIKDRNYFSHLFGELQQTLWKTNMMFIEFSKNQP